jgi:hypothetical protein
VWNRKHELIERMNADPALMGRWTLRAAVITSSLAVLKQIRKPGLPAVSTG